MPTGLSARSDRRAFGVEHLVHRRHLEQRQHRPRHDHEQETESDPRLPPQDRRLVRLEVGRGPGREARRDQQTDRRRQHEPAVRSVEHHARRREGVQREEPRGRERAPSRPGTGGRRGAGGRPRSPPGRGRRRSPRSPRTSQKCEGWCSQWTSNSGTPRTSASPSSGTASAVPRSHAGVRSAGTPHLGRTRASRSSRGSGVASGGRDVLVPVEQVRRVVGGLDLAQAVPRRPGVAGPDPVRPRRARKFT